MLLELDKLEQYSPGGSIYESLKADYGVAGANKVLDAYKTGEQGAVSDAIAELKHGPALDESTASIFGRQLANDPFAAPLASANKVIETITSSAVFGLLKNPMVLLVLVLVLVFKFGGGASTIRSALKGLK